MKDYTCLYCGIKLRGNFKGKNSVIKYRGGMLHEACEYKQKELMKKKWRDKESWNKYHKEYRSKHPEYKEYMKEYMRYYKVKVL